MDNGDAMILVCLSVIAVMFILTSDFNAGSLFYWLAHNWWFDVSVCLIWAIWIYRKRKEYNTMK